MSKNLRNFLIVFISILLMAFGISYGYNKYQERKIEKTINAFTGALLGKETKKEKSLFTRLKEKVFGSEEEKTIKELTKKYEELLKFENSFNQEIDEAKKEKMMEGYVQLTNEIRELQDKYYSLAGEYYKLENIETTETTVNKVQEQPRTPKQKEIASEKENSNNSNSSSEDIFKDGLKNKYYEQNYMLDKNSFFQNLKVAFGANKVEKLTSENGNKVKITYKENETFVEEYLEDKLVKIIDYKTEDNYQTVQVKIEDIEKEFTRTLENMVGGYGVDEYKDGSKVEFQHRAMLPNGAAVRYYSNGDREEFIYKDGIRNGFSTYYFTNGDKEEVYYLNDKLEGKAKYIYADGYVETTLYKDGQRVD